MIPKVCLQPGCGQIGEWKHGYCPNHERGYRKAQANRGAFSTNSPMWTRFVSNLRAQGNVFCQSVNWQGVRCGNPTWGFHHIIPVDARPDLGVHPENVVGVCQGCHNEAEAHPDKARFVPTLYRPPLSSDPLPTDAVGPGRYVPRQVDLWTLANRREVLANGIYH